MRLILLFIFFVFSLNINCQNTLFYTYYKTYSNQLQKDADAGNPEAIASLGSCYDRADGIGQDRKKAFELFKKAAAMNDKVGMYNLAHYYEIGFIGEKDFSTAVMLHKRVLEIDANFVSAIFKLATIYDKGGFGVAKNLSTACYYWEMLAKMNSSFSILAEFQSGWHYYDGLGRDRDISKAKQYFLSAAKRGLTEKNTFAYAAMDNLATCYMQERNHTEAAYWLLQAYKRGHYPVCGTLGGLYYEGLGVKQSYKKAFEIYSKGEKDSPHCKYVLSLMYRYGLGVERDTAKAAMLLEESAIKGFAYAQYLYGCDKFSGTYTSKDYGVAVEYLTKVLDNQYLPEYANKEVYFKLSTCYRFGLGVKADISKAEEYLSKSNALGGRNANRIHEMLNEAGHGENSQFPIQVRLECEPDVRYLLKDALISLNDHGLLCEYYAPVNDDLTFSYENARIGDAITVRSNYFGNVIYRINEIPKGEIVINMAISKFHGNLTLPDGEPCAGALISQKRGEKLIEKAISDFDGKFTLKDVRYGDVLYITFSEYQEKEVHFDDNVPNNFSTKFKNALVSGRIYPEIIYY